MIILYKSIYWKPDRKNKILSKKIYPYVFVSDNGNNGNSVENMVHFKIRGFFFFFAFYDRHGR